MHTRADIMERLKTGGDLAGIESTMTFHRSAGARGATDEEVEKVRSALGEDAASGRIIPFVISSEARASDGHTIKATGWELDGYQRNPVVLFNHDRWMPRIGESIVEVVGSELHGLAAFHPRERSELSYSLGEIAATRGHAASVGFKILSAVRAPDEITEQVPWALDIHAAELREWSLVNIGADPNALAQARSAGLDITPIVEALARALEERLLAGAPKAAVATVVAEHSEEKIIIDFGAVRKAAIESVKGNTP